MRCIGTYYSDYGLALLYQLDYKKSGWITNICFQNPTSGSWYSPTMAHIAMNGRDQDGRQRDGAFWAQFVSVAHDSYVLL